MKKALFGFIIFLLLLPVVFFVKSWVDSKEPQISSVDLIPKKKVYNVGEEVTVKLKLKIPLHLEVLSLQFILPKDILQIKENSYQEKITFGNYKTSEFQLTIAAIKQIQLKKVELELLAKGKQKFVITFNKTLDFIESKDLPKFELELIKSLEDIKAISEKKDTTNWLLIFLLLIVSAVSFIVLFMYLKKGKIKSPYEIALESLSKMQEDNVQMLDDIISRYLDALFMVNLSYATHTQKVALVQQIKINQQCKDDLAVFYKKAELIKFVPDYKYEKTPITKDKLEKIIDTIHREEQEK